MANDINISDLTFDGIRNSLVEYLKTQDTLKDYNFEGSAIRTLVDLLAYNTFYYGYYSNMIANEMFLDTAKLSSSIISLTKPLGYVVPGFKSASMSLRFFDLKLPTTPEISPYSTFKSRDVTGKEFFFYNIDAIPILDTSLTSGSAPPRQIYYTEPFVIYEGKSRVYRQLINVNLSTQTIILNDINIDPRTISIEVKKKNDTTQSLSKWKSYYLEPETIVDSNTNIFFIERLKNGYKVNFGKFTSADFGSVSTGKRIVSDDQVYISYLVASGSQGNNTTNFTFIAESQNKSITKPTTRLTQLISSSKGGTDEPNLDEVRFFAPKTFARQNRLVTKNDYSSLMAELGYGVTLNNQFKIISGEELNPPSYGRVFVSVIGLTGSQSGEINQILSTLKSKSVVGILPEYLTPVQVKMDIDVKFSIPNMTGPRRAQASSAARAAIYNKYRDPKFDRIIDKTQISELIRNSFPGVNLNPDNLKLLFTVSLPEIVETLGSVGRRINIKNKIKLPYIPAGLTASRQTVRLFPSVATAEQYEIKNATNTGKFLYYYTSQNQRRNVVGEVDYNNGVVILYPQVSSSGFTVFFELENDTFIGIDQLACYLPNSVINLKIVVA